MARERNVGRKRMRQPPKTNGIETWIKAGDDGAKEAEVAEQEEALGARVTRVPDLNQASRSKNPTGPGLVERADGRVRRRLVVYVEPDRAKNLKLQAVMLGLDMSDIVDELLERWLAGELGVA